MKLEEATKKLSKAARVVLSSGEESFFIDQSKEIWLRNLSLCNEDTLKVVHVSDFSLKSSAIYLLEYSLLGGRNILVIELEEKTVEDKLFSDVVKSMPDDSYLMVVLRTSKTPSWLEKLRPKFLEVDCEPLAKAGTLTWLRRNQVKMGLDLNEVQLSLILERVGVESLRKLHSVLEKLSLISEKGKVSEQLLDFMVPKEAAESVFLLTDAIYNKDTKKALALLDSITEKTGSYLPIISLMQKSLEKQCILYSMMRDSLSLEDMMKFTGLPKFVVEKETKRLKDFVRNFGQLKIYLKRICYLEIQSRRNSDQVPLKFQNMVVKMTKGY